YNKIINKLTRKIYIPPRPYQCMEIGVVSNYFEHVNAAAIKLTKPLKVGDKIQIKGGETDFEQKVESMQIDKKKVDYDYKSYNGVITLGLPAGRYEVILKLNDTPIRIIGNMITLIGTPLFLALYFKKSHFLK
ncbi:MAG: hypothetical protein US95_C0029G0009, partial [Candidatus Woesebacteria bacterium GW2011_GWB1_38_5]